MSATDRTTWMAAALVAIVIALPSAAWWIAGSEALARDERDRVGRALARAEDGAELLASRAAARLDSLREVESDRPFRHYAHLERLGEDACDCPGLELAPTAAASPDPIVRAHFEIGDSERVALYAHRRGREPDTSRRTLDALRPVARELVASLAAPPSRDELLEPSSPSDGPVAKEPPATTSATPDLGRELSGETLLAQGAFRWRSVALDGTPSLVAVRRVRTDARTIVQGFVVDTDRLVERLDADVAVRLVDGEAGAAGSATLPIASVAWSIALDASADLEAAERTAASQRRRFVSTFVAGVAAAILCGTLVVALVRQSGVIARDRARFAAAAAHELRSPLAGLRLHAELLAEGLGCEDRVDRYARAIAADAAELDRVVANVLSFSGLERGDPGLEPRVADVAGAVREIVEEARPALAALETRVEATLPDRPVDARFDRVALARILTNLLDNAARHGRGPVEVALDRRDGRVEIAVRDQGHGVDARDVARAISGRPLSGRRRPADAGLGIGLALSSRLARAMDGSIARRDGARGTTIVLSLPAS